MKTTFKLLTLVFVSVAVSAGNFALSAQNNDSKLDSISVKALIPAGYELVDSLVYRYAATQDSLYSGKNILQIMPTKAKGGNADVEISQSERVTNALNKHINNNRTRTMQGYRVRIFFDNSQTARENSAGVLYAFRQKFKGIRAYRVYVNPYFKVTVGDFRTKSEAMALLKQLKGRFPSAFVVKEKINYPAVDAANAYVVDTLKVLKPIRSEQ